MNVFGVVEGGRVRCRLACLLDVSGLSRVDALEDAQSSKVGQRYLELPHCLCSGDVVFRLARLAFLLLLGHGRLHEKVDLVLAQAQSGTEGTKMRRGQKKSRSGEAGGD